MDLARRPHLSVVMPVFNAMPYLDAAVQSILGQSFGDFEFIAFDDCSTDGSRERLRFWAKQDSRVRLTCADRNSGPAASSNRAVAEARGSLIARMDADDLSDPRRLERQARLLQERPDLVLVGTLSEVIDAEGRVVRGPDFWRLGQKSWFAPFPHGSVMYRRSAFDLVGGYREGCAYWEDVDLFLRMASVGEVATIADALYQHRHSSVSTRLASVPSRVEGALTLMFTCLDRLDRGLPYEDLIPSAPASSPQERVDPRVFISRGSVILWSGDRPKMIRRLISRGRLRPDAATAAAFAWSIWAAVGPASLRAFLRALATYRNRLSDCSSRATDAVDWILPRGSSQVRAAKPPPPSDN